MFTIAIFIVSSILSFNPKQEVVCYKVFEGKRMCEKYITFDSKEK